jgi:hypothetical protein
MDFPAGNNTTTAERLYSLRGKTEAPSTGIGGNKT